MSLSMPEQTTRSFPKKIAGLAVAAAIALAAFAVSYWYQTGRIGFSGILQNAVIPVYARHDGRIVEVKAAPGMAVAAGDVLLRFDDGAARAAFAQEQKKLTRLEALLPPSFVRANAFGQSGEPGESMTDKVERLRVREAAAEARVRDASDYEAKAAVAFARISSRVASGSSAQSEMAGAERALEKARARVAEAKKNFEQLSLERSLAVSAVQKMKDTQAALGANAVPVEVRVKNYQEQRQRVEAFAASFQDIVMQAPENGVIIDVSVAPGDSVAPMHPCFLLRSDGRPLMIRAVTDVKIASRAKLGQACDITVHAERDITVPGYISAISPGVPPGTFTAPAVVASASGSSGASEKPEQSGQQQAGLPSEQSATGQPEGQLVGIWVTLDLEEAAEHAEALNSLSSGTLADVVVHVRKIVEMKKAEQPQRKAGGQKKPERAAGQQAVPQPQQAVPQPQQADAVQQPSGAVQQQTAPLPQQADAVQQSAGTTQQETAVPINEQAAEAPAAAGADGIPAGTVGTAAAAQTPQRAIPEQRMPQDADRTQESAVSATVPENSSDGGAWGDAAPSRDASIVFPQPVGSK